MFEKLEKKRNWISDKLIQYIDIVFGVIVGQSILRNVNLVKNPLSYPFASICLLIIITTVTLSWIGYHKSMYTYPYKAEILSLRRIRPFTDFIIVLVYARLLFTVDDFKIDVANINLYSFILCYIVIFAFYLIDGMIRINEYHDQKASKLKISLKFMIYYIFIFISYLIWESQKLPRLEIINFLFLFLCLGFYLCYRIQRELHYPESVLTIVVDIDGVLAEQVTPVLEQINNKFGTDYKKEDILRWDQPLEKANTDIKTEIERSQKDPKFIQKMDLIPDALDTVRELSKYCEITIATHRPRKSDNPTKKWLRKNNIPFDNYINTSKKGKGSVEGNIIIDDYPNNTINFVKQTQKGRTAFLFTQPWNKDDQSIKSHKNIIRVNVWKDVLKQITEYINTQ